jgi:hypothetical protein
MIYDYKFENYLVIISNVFGYYFGYYSKFNSEIGIEFELF